MRTWERPISGTTGTWEPWDVAEIALAGLEDVMAGADGWGSEPQIFAIDRLRRFLGKPEWCARCVEEGHTTYSHFKADAA